MRRLLDLIGDWISEFIWRSVARSDRKRREQRELRQGRMD